MNIAKTMNVHLLILKIKSIFTVLFLLLLTGCSVEYNLDISKNEYIENIDILDGIITLNGEDANKKLNEIIRSNKTIGGPLYGYNVEKILNNDQYGLKLNLDNYDLSTFKTCFSNFDISMVNDYYILKGDSGFNCLNIWNKDYTIKININIDGKIIDSNANQVRNNIATWYIDSENDYVYLKYSLNDKNDKNNQNNLLGIILVCSLLIVIALIMVYIYIKNKKNNEI